MENKSLYIFKPFIFPSAETLDRLAWLNVWSNSLILYREPLNSKGTSDVTIAGNALHSQNESKAPVSQLMNELD